MAAKICHQLLGAFLTILVLQPLVVKSRAVKRCPGDNGGPTTSGSLIHLDVNMNNSISGERWHKFPVTYGFRSGNVVPPGLDLQEVTSVIDEAFGKWEAAVPDPRFGFQRIPQGDNANIKILFTPLPGYFGYGYAPPDGSFYLDNSHTSWSTKPSPAGNEVDLLSSVMNVVGHTLGLGDSSNPTAVMYPTLYYGSIRRNLSPDDISRMQNLYGCTCRLELAKPI